MDKKVSLELEKINDRFDKLDTKLDENTVEGNRLALAFIGFSVAMVGIALWFQTGKIQIETWSAPSNILVFYGTLIVVLARFSNKKSFRKWLMIAIWVSSAILILGIIAIAVIIFLY